MSVAPLSLDSSRWGELTHVYGTAEDIPGAIKALEVMPVITWDSDGPLEAIAAAVYHQGDPDTASYATTPHLMRIANGRAPAERIWLIYLVGWIEAARNESRPAIPDDLIGAYQSAIAEAKIMAIDLLRSDDRSWGNKNPSFDLAYLFGAIAAFEGERKLAEHLNMLDALIDAYERSEG